jgi:hypothetical protein
MKSLLFQWRDDCGRKVRTCGLLALFAGLVVTFSQAAPLPLNADHITVSGNELQSVILSGVSIPRSNLVQITLDSWSGGSGTALLVADTGEPNGAAVTLTPAQRRALLEDDWRLDTGLINPANSPTAVQARFKSPIQNKPGFDLVVFEFQGAANADPFRFTINGVTVTVDGTQYGDTGYSFSSGDALSIGATPTNLDALLTNNLTIAIDSIFNRVLGVALDLSDFGVPPNGVVTNFFFGSATTAYFDPVLIAGIATNAPSQEPKPFAIIGSVLSLDSNTVSLTWSSRPGTNYAIQSSVLPVTNIWLDEITNVTAQGWLTTRTISNALTAPARFFRVQETTPPPLPPEILLRSSWQTVNIGDIAHSPGVLELIRTHITNASVTLWAGDVGRGVREMLLTNFPTLRIVQGDIAGNGLPNNSDLQAAWNRASLLVHGSGPLLLAESHVNAWRLATGKPYGIYGVTQGGVPGGTTKTVYDGAAFVYLRDTRSLTNVRNAGVTSPVIEFAPDGTFGLALRNEALATNYLAQQGLTDKQFLCVIPRLRWTPYWLTGSPYDAAKDAENEQWKEIDHAKLRECIIQWVRQTGQKVLACPEMTYQVDLIPELIINPLPEDVRTNVVWRNTYWLPDGAASVYARAAAVVSFECHSPIIALANATPAIYVRQPTDSIKGQMYRDIGVPQWIMEIDAVTGADIAARALAIHNDPATAQATLTNAMNYVRQRQQQSMSVMRAALGLP